MNTDRIDSTKDERKPEQPKSSHKRKERDDSDDADREQVECKKKPDRPDNHFSLTEGCRSVDLYDRLEKIGEGTYGAVYKARCKETNEFMALKKLKLENEKEGFPITSIRETITLLKGKHPNVIDVREIVFGNRLDQIYIVMEYMDRDLKSLMQDMKRPFKMEEVKLLMHQLINAVAHLHNNWILHRDLKTSNLLINKGILKVGDFGLAREYGSPLKQFTNKVVTLWYRAPELLLQTGRSEAQQIDLIFEALGSPNGSMWPDFDKIRMIQKFKFPVYKYNRLLDKLNDKKKLSDQGFYFWNRLLTYDPGVKTISGSETKLVKSSHHRITAEDALKHEFFKEEPRPIHPSLFPTWPSNKRAAE